MKTMKQLSSTIACIAVAAIVAGCASSGYQKGNKTAEDIQTAANEIDKVSTQIDSTIKAMNALVETPQADLVPQFKEFSSSLADLKSAADKVVSLRATMAENGKAFLEQWDQQLAAIKNEDIKARSQARKEEVSKALTSIKASYAEAASAFKPFMSELQDVQKYLSVDLTKGGIDAIKEPAAKAVAQSATVKEAIAKLSGEFRSLGLAMSSSAPAQQQAQ